MPIFVPLEISQDTAAQVPDPGVALLAFALGLGLLAALFWPRAGILRIIVRATGSTERVRLEDTLKHIFKCERRGRTATVESLAGALETSRARASRLLRLVQERELAAPSGDGFRLTEAGREYAVQIVRGHRLWERYLAEHTGVDPELWHELAEEREHKLSAEARDRLSAAMGHPTFDPHGDPIPTAEGTLPEPAGETLVVLSEGDSGVISHIEDEPYEVYKRVLALGLAPGMPIEIGSVDSRGFDLFVEGREVRVDRAAAANVTVESHPDVEPDFARHRTLADTGPGESVRVAAISRAIQGPQRRRLLDLGVVPGTVVERSFSSASGDPVAYTIRGALVALRRSQARGILIDDDSALQESA